MTEIDNILPEKPDQWARPDTIAGLLKALIKHYSGDSIVQAFSTDDTPSRATYYQLKSAYPDEVAVLEDEAAAIARRNTMLAVLSTHSAMVEASDEIRREAAEATQKAIANLKLIALGATFKVEVLDKDGSTRERTIVSYPRDMIDAARLLQQYALHGVVDEGLSLAEARQQDEGAHSFGGFTLGVPINFSNVSVTSADGTTYSASITHEDVIDAEVEEDQD